MDINYWAKEGDFWLVWNHEVTLLSSKPKFLTGPLAPHSALVCTYKNLYIVKFSSIEFMIVAAEPCNCLFEGCYTWIVVLVDNRGDAIHK